MRPRVVRGTAVAISALLCVWFASAAAATQTSYEWYVVVNGQSVHVAEIKQDFVSWQVLKQYSSPDYRGNGLNFFRWSVTPDRGNIVYLDQFSIANPSGAPVYYEYNSVGASTWAFETPAPPGAVPDPVHGTVYAQWTWNRGSGLFMDGNTGDFRLWSTGAESETLTGSAHGRVLGVVQTVTGPICGPAVPEPTSLLLLALGAVGLLPMARRCRKG